MKNAARKRQFRRQIRELDNHQSSRNRIDQDEFEIRRQMRDEKTNLKFKALDSRSRNSRSRIRRSISRSRIEQRNEKDEFEIRIENSSFEKSNRATKRKRRIRNSTRKFKELELETRNSRSRI